MERFCRALHPNLELGTVCVAWFRQATKHCTEIQSGIRLPTAYFWTTVKNFIFPDRNTHMSQNMPINPHPERLSIQDCQSLFLGMARDYVRGAPHYIAESTTNFMLWQVLYSLMGIMAMGSFLLGTIYTYKKYGQTKPKIYPLDEILKSEEYIGAVAKRSIYLPKAEIRNVQKKLPGKKKDINAAEGAEVLTLKVDNKYKFLDTVVEGCLAREGKLCRLYDQYNKTKYDFKIEALNKAIKFLGNDCQKLHLLFMFEDDVPLEEAKKCKNTSPRIKSLSPPTKLSPRNINLSPKETSNNRLQGGTIFNKEAETNTGPSSAFFNSPKLTKSLMLVTRPRCGRFVSSCIPRNIPKHSALFRKSN